MIRATRSIMGMPVKLAIADSQANSSDAEAVFQWLHEVDDRFSTYKPTSEISQLNSGRLQLPDASAVMQEVWRMCEAAKTASGGYFDIWNGTIHDPSGLVKGWAIELAGKLLLQRNRRNFFVDVGGDLIAMGTAEAGRPWRIGVRHPTQRDKFAKVLNLSDAGIATSGHYERGNHIYDPVTGRVPTGLHSFTVVGPSVMTADLLATIGYAMGPELGLAYVDKQPGYGALAITEHMEGLSTPVFRQYNQA